MKRSLIAYMMTLTLVLALGAMACGEDSSPSLDDTSWVLESYGPQGATQALLADTEITAEFDGSEATLTGSAGCNSYFTDYAVEGSDLTLSTLAWTERACLGPEGVMDQELAYLGALGTVDRFEVDDTTLRLFYSGGVLVFEAHEGE
ncbi:MAG: META domain-containing protein [Dehalococcoidia bacterium]